ncbi:hypothetical protein BFR06_20400 [Burkholderia pseudomallei]|nr:hypothetical protein BFR05_20390 [Burkholderia pseudomallei]APG00308.1 hypothetical protein BFR06_20400 [Burkholderia pseudomallei]KEO70072.1 hypothetical protein J103_08105 [Burkholderia pseudomallei MSHR5855]
MTVIQCIAKQKKTALLGGKQKHQAHHDSESSLVKVLLPDTVQEPPVLFDIDAVKCLNQYLDRLQHLLTELVSNFLLIQCAFREHVRKSFVLCYTKETTNSE